MVDSQSERKEGGSRVDARPTGGRTPALVYVAGVVIGGGLGLVAVLLVTLTAIFS